MKKLLLISTLLISLNSWSKTLDTLSISTDFNLPKPQPESVSTGITSLVCGLLITSIGVVREVNRKPEPYHAHMIDYNSNAGRTLNMMMIGSGLTFTGIGVKLLIKF